MGNSRKTKKMKGGSSAIVKGVTGLGLGLSAYYLYNKSPKNNKKKLDKEEFLKKQEDASDEANKQQSQYQCRLLDHTELKKLNEAYDKCQASKDIEEKRKTWRRNSVVVHPDKNNGCPVTAQDLFKKFTNVCNIQDGGKLKTRTNKKKSNRKNYNRKKYNIKKTNRKNSNRKKTNRKRTTLERTNRNS